MTLLNPVVLRIERPLSYDSESKLTGASGTATATSTYDGDGNRVKATDGGVTTVSP
jgi:hypothetical protein